MGAGPFETVRSTRAPFFSFFPAFADCEMTSPLETLDECFDGR